MALAAILETLDGLSDDLKKEYVEKDGKFVLDVTPVGDVRLEDVGGLQKSLAAARRERDEFKGKLGGFDGLDADEARRAIEALANQDGEGGDLEEKIRSRFEAKEQTFLERHRREMEQREERISKLVSKNHGLVMDQAVAEAIREHKGKERFLAHEVRRRLKVEEDANGDYQLSVLADDGEVTYSKKAGDSGRMTVKEFVGTLKEDPEWGDAFEGTGATGGGATGSTAGRSGSGRIDPNLPISERLARAYESSGS